MLNIIFNIPHYVLWLIRLPFYLVIYLFLFIEQTIDIMIDMYQQFKQEKLDPIIRKK